MRRRLLWPLLLLLELLQHARATGSPSASPTLSPGTYGPSSSPTDTPTQTPSSTSPRTVFPTSTSNPSEAPTAAPTTCPSSSPRSLAPSITFNPTVSPSSQCPIAQEPSLAPSVSPRTVCPTSTLNPSKSPTEAPSACPSSSPRSLAPTATNNPTMNPSTQCPITQEPSLAPSISPRTVCPTSTLNPSKSPTQAPSACPSSSPRSLAPTATNNPTLSPSSQCPITQEPSLAPSVSPRTVCPTSTLNPSKSPTQGPTLSPTRVPTITCNPTSAAPSSSPFTFGPTEFKQVRLRGDEDWDIPSVPSRGLLEVYDAGDWRAIDYSDFSSESSDVVCKEFDYDSGVATLSDTIPLGGGIEPAATLVNCHGTENYFLDCGGNFFEGASCTGSCSNIIYIHCKRHCRNSIGGIDNSMVFEPSTDRCEAYNGTAYRLSGTPFKQKGRVEYLYRGFWYSIAYLGTFTTYRDRFVNGVCGILGYANGAASTSEGFGLAPPASFVISSWNYGLSAYLTLSSKPQSSKPEKILGATCFKACNFTLEYFDLAADACLNITVFNCPAGQYLTPATLISNGKCSACAPGMYTNGTNHTFTYCSICTCPGVTFMRQQCDGKGNNAICASCNLDPDCGEAVPYRIDGKYNSSGNVEMFAGASWKIMSNQYSRSVISSLSIPPTLSKFGALLCAAYGYNSSILRTGKARDRNTISAVWCSKNVVALADCTARREHNITGKSLRVQCLRACNFATEYFSAASDSCMPRLIHSCPRGFYYMNGTQTRDARCRECSSGTYITNNTHTLQECEVCSRCPEGAVLEKACNSTHDNPDCRSCPTLSNCGQQTGVRLANNETSLGYPEVYFGGEWRPIGLPDMPQQYLFTYKTLEASRLCKDLGFAAGIWYSLKLDELTYQTRKFPATSVNCLSTSSSYLACNGTWKLHNSTGHRLGQVRCFKNCSFAHEIYDNTIDACLPANNLNCGPGSYLVPKTYFDHGKCLTCKKGFYMPHASHNFTSCARCTRCPGELIFGGYCNATHDNNHCISKSPTSSCPTTSSPTTRSPSTAAPTRSPSTRSPSSRAPTTASPSTLSPSSCSPTSTSPTTMSPSTLGPVSVSPTTCQPTTGSPSTMAPTTGAPSTTSPSTVSPSSHSPTQSPTSLSPSTSNPTMQTPTLIDIRLTDEATAITFVFHESTNMPKAPSRDPAATCELLLDSSSLLLLGIAPHCYWQTASTVILYLGREFSANLYDTMGIAGGRVKRDTEVQELYSPAHSRPLMPPYNPIPVQMQITGPSEVGVCDSGVKLTALATGAAGRSFLFRWELKAVRLSNNASSYGTAAITDVRDVLAATAVSRSNSTVFVPTLALPIGATFVISARVENWLGSASTSDFELRKTNKLTLVVRVPSGPSVPARRSQPLRIPVQVRAPQCSALNQDGLANTLLKTRSLWTLLDKSSSALSVQIPNPATFYLEIPPYKLEMEKWYLFQLYSHTVDVHGQLIGNVTLSFNVSVVLEPVIARIYGGDFRKVSINTDGSSPGVVEFDASASYDQENPSAPLNFSWSVWQEAVGNGGATVAIPIPATSQSALQVPFSSLVSGREYVVKVVASSKSRNATALQRVRVSNEGIPDVFISGLSTGSTSFGAQEELRVATEVKALSASRRLRYQWSCTSGNFDLADESLVLTETSNPSLALKPFALAPGVAYTFAVSVFEEGRGSDSVFGEARISVSIRSPPSLGSCFARPESGVGMETMFSLGCKLWSGAGEPFRYRFQAHVSGAFTDLCELRYMNEYETQLPGTNDRTRLRGVIVDAFGVRAYGDFHATVVPAQNFNADEGLRALGERGREGDFQAYAATFASISTQLSADTIPLRVAKEVRNSLLQSLNQTISSLFPESSASLLRLVSTYTVAEELSSSNKQSLLQMGKGLLLGGNGTAYSSEDPVDLEAVTNILASVGNVVAASVQPGYRLSTNSSNDAEDVISLIARNLVRESVAGERQKSLKTSSGGVGIEVYGVVFDAGKGAPSLHFGSLNFSASFPSLGGFLSPNSSASIVASTVTNDTLHSRNRGQRKQALYHQDIERGSGQGNEAEMQEIYDDSKWVSGGLTTVQIFDENREEVAISGLRGEDRINITIPTGRNATSPLGYHSAKCLFWQAATSTWSSRGVRSVGVDDEGRVTCSASHLTAFSSEMEFEFEINTISAESLSLAAFSPASNPVMLLVFLMISIFLISYSVAFYRDYQRYEAASHSADLSEFWRTMNLMRFYRSRSRTMERFVASSKWALRRKHTWYSIIYHPSGDFMTSGKRLILLLVLLFNSSVVCALFVGTEQRLPFLTPTLASALVGFVFSYPVPFVMGSLFYTPMPRSFLVKIDRGSGDSFMSYFLLFFSLCSGEIGNDIEIEEGDDDDAAPDAEEGDMEADDLDEGNNEEALVNEENRDDSDSDEGPNNIQAGAKSLLSTAQAKVLPTVPIMEEGKRARRSIAEHGATGGATALGGIVGREMGKNFAKRQRSSDKSRSAREGKESCSMLGHRQSASLETDSPVLPLSSTNTTLRKNGWVDASSDLSSRSYDRATQHSRIHSSNASSSGLVVAIQKSQKPEKHRFNRISTMQTQKTRRMLSRRSSTRFQLNVFPKDSFVPSRNNLKLPPFWTRKDTYIILAFTIFILGAVFMLAALSWQYRDSNDSSVVAALTAFGEDILFRTFIIITVEAVLLLPCCCQSGGGQVRGPSAVAPREDSRSFYLQPDVNYFRYDKAAVLVTVTPQGEVIGLRRGWKVKSINGDGVSNGTECFAKLRAATKIAGPFEIEFDTSGSQENWVSAPILPEGHLAANDRGKKQEEMSSLSCTSSNLSFFSNLKDQDPRLFLPPGRNASREPSRPSTAMFFGSRSRPTTSAGFKSLLSTFLRLPPEEVKEFEVDSSDSSSVGPEPQSDEDVKMKI